MKLGFTCFPGLQTSLMFETTADFEGSELNCDSMEFLISRYSVGMLPSTTNRELTSPPKARLAFRVGVVGHRPNRLKNADRDRLTEIMHAILDTVMAEVGKFASSPEAAKLYSGETPILRAITPLAEGTDRIFADQALPLGYELCCPMPFQQAEYELDFQKPCALEDDSLSCFKGLLAKARAAHGLTIFQLDGDRTRGAEAYGAAGRIVLNQSDLLVVVWDGGKPAGGGGTVDTLKEAIGYRVPVLWIGAVKPHPWRMLESDQDIECLEGSDQCVPEQSPLSIHEVVTRVVREEISLPIVSQPTARREEQEDPVTPERYFEESKGRLHLAVPWKFFRDVVGSGPLQWPNLIVSDYQKELRATWPTDSGNYTARWANEKLLPHYAWADKLADRYADAYRSTYIFIYLSASLAVFLALLPMAAGWEESAHGRSAFCITGEFVILGMITVLLWWEKNRYWHKRWMAYRLLAELIRQLKCLLPLGGGRPLPRVPQHLALFGDPTQTWMYWQLRAIARATAIPSASVTAAYLGECLDYLDQLVRGSDGQIAFHVQNYERSERLNHRLHRVALWMFGLTLACIVVHLQPSLFFWLGIPAGPVPALDRWLTLACATLPAFGAAMGGISNQGEFVRIAKRSKSMADALTRRAERIDELLAQQEPKVRLPQVARLAHEITQLMVAEVVEWRIIFVDRPTTAA
jgi:hypothetical protein